MNWKNRLKNYNFWISIFSAVLLILQALKIEFDIVYVNEIFTAVLGLLVVIGIISDPTRTTVKTIETIAPTETTKTAISENEVKDDVVENKLPTNEENEINDVNHEIDFQAIFDKITVELEDKKNVLEQKIKELEKLNCQTLLKLSEEKQNNVKEVVQEKTLTQECSAPAVAEMENPYVDVIN